MPKPKATRIVCDTCGLDWSLHKKSKTDSAPLSECVRLLKAELAKPKQLPFIIGGSGSGIGNWSSNISATN